MDEDQKPTTNEDITIDFPKYIDDNIRATLKKHERAWYAQLGEINVS